MSRSHYCEGPFLTKLFQNRKNGSRKNVYDFHKISLIIDLDLQNFKNSLYTYFLTKINGFVSFLKKVQWCKY